MLLRLATPICQNRQPRLSLSVYALALEFIRGWYSYSHVLSKGIAIVSRVDIVGSSFDGLCFELRWIYHSAVEKKWISPLARADICRRSHGKNETIQAIGVDVTTLQADAVCFPELIRSKHSPTRLWFASESWELMNFFLLHLNTFWSSFIPTMCESNEPAGSIFPWQAAYPQRRETGCSCAIEANEHL